MTDFDALPGVYRALFLYIEPGIYLSSTHTVFPLSRLGSM